MKDREQICISSNYSRFHYLAIQLFCAILLFYRSQMSSSSTGEITRDPRKLYITKLPLTFTSRDLRVLFEVYGEVTYYKILEQKFSGAHKSGIVTFLREEDGKRALKEANGLLIKGSFQKLEVCIRRPSKYDIKHSRFGDWIHLDTGATRRSRERETVRGEEKKDKTTRQNAAPRENSPAKEKGRRRSREREYRRERELTSHHSHSERSLSPNRYKPKEGRKSKQNETPRSEAQVTS